MNIKNLEEKGLQSLITYSKTKTIGHFMKLIEIKILIIKKENKYHLILTNKAICPHQKAK